MNKIIRYQIADYLKTGETTDSTPAAIFSLMGSGFTALDEKPAAKVDKTAYITDKSTSGTITGYENTFSFDTQLISDDDAIAYLYEVARNQKTGADAETEYVRVDLYGTPTGSGSTSYPARKFKVAVEVTQITGAGTEIMKVAGNLHQIGDFVEGTFDISGKTFTAAS